MDNAEAQHVASEERYEVLRESLAKKLHEHLAAAVARETAKTRG
jgi:hypothetical protein